MRASLCVGLLIAATAAVIAAQSELPPRHSPPEFPTQNAEILLVLDTTGSMAPVLGAIKRGIEPLVGQLRKKYPEDSLKIGLVAYRDHGESYLTRQCHLTSPAALIDCLTEIKTGGGGDVPEAVLDGLNIASSEFTERNTGSYRAMFLIGDAPGHHHAAQKIDELVRKNTQQGVITHTLQWGKHRKTTEQWQRIAQLGGGQYRLLQPAGNPLEGVIASMML